MEEPEVFVLADEAMNEVVGRIRPDQWEMAMPADFSRAPSDEVPSLRTIVAYHAYDDAWVPDMLAGLTMDEVGRDAYSGDLLGEDPPAAFAAIVKRACAAARAVEDLEGIVHCSFGDYTTRQYFWQINSFRALRAHDLAKVIGVDVALSAELVQGVWDEVRPHAEEWRAIGVFPEAVPVPQDAPLLDRLLGLTGRQPSPGVTGPATQ